MSFAVVRVRGHVNVRRDIKDTMRMLHLTRVNHLTFIPRNPDFVGMLNKVKDYVTWGEAEPEVLAKLLLRRGRVEGNKPIDDAYVKTNSKYTSVWDFAQAIARGEAGLSAVKGLKPVLRLSPPRKGYEGIKRSYKEGGALGYRGAAINELLTRMTGEEGK